MKELNPRQAEGYRHDGFLFPLEGPSKEKAATCFSMLADIEAHIGASLSVRENAQWRSSPHTYLPVFDRLVRNPRILDAVEDLIGPDLPVYTITFFIKEAGALTFAAWHQDATYFGVQPHQHVVGYQRYGEH